MLVNGTSADQTIYIFISDVGASVIVGDRGIASQMCWGGGNGLPEEFRIFMHFRHVL